MPRYGFIDESGTLDNQKVLTVALVIFEGARTAEKLHLKIAKSVFPEPKTKGLREREEWCAAQRLHFADMDDDQKLATTVLLAKANITAIVASYWHTEKSTNHEHRFLMYKTLVKATVINAFKKFDHLIISIAKQGGWENYRKPFLQESRLLPDYFTKAGVFRKGQFFLASASKPGVQVADFYASSTRSYLLASLSPLQSEPYEHIQHHIEHCEVADLVAEGLIKGK